MDLVLNWMWQGSAVALAVAAVLRISRPVPARVRYRIWWAALLIVSTLPVWVPGPSSERAVLRTPESEALLPVIHLPAAAAQASGALPAGLWLAWIVWQGGRLSAGILRTRRVRRASVPVAPGVERQLRRWSTLSAHGRHAPLVLSHMVRSAAVLGAGRPLIAVSPRLFERLSADDLDLIVVHERAHVQRRDDLAVPLQQAVLAVLGWHPAVWWIARRIDVEREVACDEMAARVAGSPKRYATCLVRLAGLQLPAASDLTAAAIARTGLGTRVSRLLDRRPAVRWRTAVGTAACSATMAGAPLLASGVPLFAAAVPGGSTVVADAGLETGTRRIPPPTVVARREPRPPGSANPAIVLRAATTEARPWRHSGPAGTSLPARPPRQRMPPREQPSAAVSEVRALAAPEYAVPAAGPLDALPGLIVAPGSGRPLAAAAAKPASGGTPWRAAAEAGVSIGRGSKKAAGAAASTFSRFGRRIAGSF